MEFTFNEEEEIIIELALKEYLRNHGYINDLRFLSISSFLGLIKKTNEYSYKRKESA